MTELVPIPSPGLPLMLGEPGAPLVVLLHDWYGRLPWLELYGRALARVGYRVVLPDLFGGFATTERETAQDLMDGLDVGATLAQLEDLIASERTVGSERVGVVGFSMGGWLALLLAQGGAVDAVVAYYATLAADEHGIVPCPVMLHFAEYDDWDEGQEPEEFIARLKEHETPVSEHSYVGTVHGFANATVHEHLDQDAAALAYARTAAYLDDYLVE